MTIRTSLALLLIASALTTALVDSASAFGSRYGYGRYGYGHRFVVASHGSNTTTIKNSGNGTGNTISVN
jgi:hypothetical protein